VGDPSRKSSKLAGTLAICLALAGLGWMTLSALGVAIALLVGLLVAAWRHDNEVGACFPLTLLFVVVLLMLVLLLAMLGALWARHQ
jgi:hypothetical protein